MATAAQGVVAPAPARVRRASHNWLATIGAVLVIVFVICALFAPWLASHDPAHIELAARLQPPS
ncbi:MAG TPA: hypothetical protein VKT29_12210, partial [Terriglobales bacterium]|nr:hypothetical protein [Terriglobales bacterium]